MRRCSAQVREKVLSMSMHAYVCHHSRGRLRLRVPGARHDSGLLKRMAHAIRGVSGVRSAEFNPSTGSLLILYAEELLQNIGLLTEALAAAQLPLDIADLMELSERAGAVDEYSKAANAIGSLLRELELAVKTSTNNQFDLKVLLPIGTAVAAGLYVMSNSAAPTPVWLTLAMFTFTSFVALNQFEAERVTAPARQSSAENGYLHGTRSLSGKSTG
jgi:hypothetical protein